MKILMSERNSDKFIEFEKDYIPCVGDYVKIKDEIIKKVIARNFDLTDNVVILILE